MGSTMTLLLLLHKLGIESASKDDMHIAQRAACDHRWRVHKDYAQVRELMRLHEIEEEDAGLDEIANL